jgi:hypothetical protein
MTQARRFLLVVLWAVLPAPLVSAQDLTRYRQFQLGMDLAAIAKLADLDPSDAKVIHQRPAVIQELQWMPQRSRGSSSRTDPVMDVVFSFCDGELFRMVVNYDRYSTEGLTDEDMIEAISERYGKAERPVATIVLFTSSQVYGDREKVIARWEDAQYSFNLFRSGYRTALGMLVFTKRLDALAQAAIGQSIRLDDQEAPQREKARQEKEDAEKGAVQEKARKANKVKFRP